MGLVEDEIKKALKAGDTKKAIAIDSMLLSDETRKELVEQAQKKGWDLLHDLMLKDLKSTSDGFYLEREPGDISYNHFIGKPNLNETVLGRMKKEILELSPSSKYEVEVKLVTKHPEIIEKLKG